jgi:PAS domain S-box-containing protein
MTDTSPLVIDPSILRRILEATPGYVVVYDLDLRLRFINRIDPAYRPEDVIGASIEAFTTPEEVERFRELCEQVRQQGSPREVVSTVDHPDGARHWYVTRVMPLKDKQGVLLGFVTMATEITAQKRAELELERTRGDLVSASQRAGMGEMATGVLHNVGNVINSVNVSAASLRQELSSTHVEILARTIKLCEEQGEALPTFLTRDPRGQRVLALLSRVTQQIVDERRRFRTEVQRMIEHVNMIRSTVEVQQSLAKTGSLLEEALAQDLVERTLSMFRLDFETIRIRTEVEVEPGLRLQLDKQGTLQILINLIRNAIEAMTLVQGPRRLRIRVHASDGYVSFAVEDNGCGIAPENLDYVFRHGFTTKKTGHGFGLHASTMAAKAMGGSLRAESEGLGRGARFILSLPQNPARPTDA